MLEDDVSPRHHVETRCYHGRRMDQCGDRSWTSHRVGQPYVQRKLRRLAASTDEKTERNPREQSPVSQCLQRKTYGLRKNISILRGAKRRDDAEDSQRESEVADAISDESFARCVGCFLTIEVIADQ